MPHACSTEVLPFPGSHHNWLFPSMTSAGTRAHRSSRVYLAGSPCASSKSSSVLPGHSCQGDISQRAVSYLQGQTDKLKGGWGSYFPNRNLQGVVQYLQDGSSVGRKQLAENKPIWCTIRTWVSLQSIEESHTTPSCTRWLPLWRSATCSGLGITWLKQSLQDQHSCSFSGHTCPSGFSINYINHKSVHKYKQSLQRVNSVLGLPLGPEKVMCSLLLYQHCSLPSLPLE